MWTWLERHQYIGELQAFRERLTPILRSLFIQCKQPELHVLGPYQESDVHISPKCVSKIVILQRELVKLIESFENYMVGDVTRE
nr:coiled coil domain containing protein 162 [Hymenolepis microstoma]